jgi:Spy/CpxP family protein refolding chaperone
MATPSRSAGRRLLGLLAAATLVWSGVLMAQGPPRWWLAEDVKAQLGMTSQQSAQVEEIFQGTMPRLRDGKRELDRQERELSRLIAEGTADETMVAQQIDRVEAARADMSKTRTLMLFRMHRVLSPDQRARLKAIHDAGGDGRRGGRDSSNRRR